MKANCIVLSILFIFSICYAQDSKTAPASQEEKQCSKEAKMLIGKLTIQSGYVLDLDISGLNVLDEKAAEEIVKAPYERCTLPENRSCADCYAWAVIYDNINQKFWIERAGGIAGTLDIYGPIYLDNSGNVIKNNPADKD
jgi:hypothetical protein